MRNECNYVGERKLYLLNQVEIIIARDVTKERAIHSLYQWKNMQQLLTELLRVHCLEKMEGKNDRYLT